MQWREFLDLGEDVPDSQLREIIESQKPNQCCTLIYTSGTTGQPKGVMLSHDNVSICVDAHSENCDPGWVLRDGRGQLKSTAVLKVTASHSPHLWAACSVLYLLRAAASCWLVFLLQLTWTSIAAGRSLMLLEATEKQELVVSYLPLSHVAAQMIDIWLPVTFGGQVFFAQPDALKVKIINNKKKLVLI